MILEGIATTLNADGSTNVAPMGPIVDASMESLLLRPYQTSTTYANLKRARQGVFHVTDDVLLLAKAAVDQLEQTPPLTSCPQVEVPRLRDTCRWYAFHVETINDAQPRTEIHARVVAAGRVRDFWGLHRAKHAVVEAAILATRLNFLPLEDVLAQFKQLATLVDKTGGAQEREAFAVLERFVGSRD